MLATTAVKVPLRIDESGVARLGKSRIPLENLVHSFDGGASAEEIVASYPTLELADVYATIAFILEHREEVDEYMAQSAAESERLHREREKRYPTAELRRLIRRRAARL